MRNALPIFQRYYQVRYRDPRGGDGQMTVRSATHAHAVEQVQYVRRVNGLDPVVVLSTEALPGEARA